LPVQVENWRIRGNTTVHQNCAYKRNEPDGDLAYGQLSLENVQHQLERRQVDDVAADVHAQDENQGLEEAGTGLLGH
jgi:hypothetical protein